MKNTVYLTTILISSLLFSSCDIIKYHKPYGSSYNLDLENLSLPALSLPPPEYSKSVKLNVKSILQNPETIENLDDRLREILINAGFHHRTNEQKFHYFQVKANDQFSGFAIITDFECIDKEGKPLNNRFNDGIDRLYEHEFINRSASYTDNTNKWYETWLKNILPKPLENNNFRFFAFIFSDKYHGGKATTLKKKEMIAAMYRGANTLPLIVKKQAISTNFEFSVLVYEYKQLESWTDGRITFLEEVSATDHLAKAGILEQMNIKTP